jgi:hypothetical protein
MKSRAQITQTASQPFFLAVAGDIVKLGIGIDDVALYIGHVDNGMLV